jgi:hypothetical protein
VKRAVLALVAGTLLSMNTGALARWRMPERIPVDRLIANLTARTTENPQDASAWYSLGRAHSYAYTLKTAELGVFNGEPAPRWMQGAGAQPDAPDVGKAAKPPTEAELLKHLELGVHALSKAMELDPARAEICLTLASLLNAGTKDAAKVAVIPGVADVAAIPEVNTLDQQLADLSKDENLDHLRRALGIIATQWSLEESRASVAAALFRLRDSDNKPQREAARKLLLEDWNEQSTDLYFRAFTLALEKDSKLETQPLRGVASLVAYEAATEYVKAITARTPREQDKVRLATCQAAAKAWDKVPPSGVVTPIVLSLDGGKSLADLLAPDARVNFDLDATGTGQTWSWVKPETGLLVWDPQRTSKITSGRQLFGSVSWWMMFDHGYDALAALDDNRDGELRADELKGIAVWFDRNSNAISDPGEVTPLDQLGIAALSTRVTAHDGKSPMNGTGMTMTDGRVLPTWDWVTEPVQPKRASLVPAAVASLLAITAMFATPRRRKVPGPHA